MAFFKEPSEFKNAYTVSSFSTDESFVSSSPSAKTTCPLVNAIKIDKEIVAVFLIIDIIFPPLFFSFEYL